MAEDNPRSFDLKSWQGLTEVLKYARESDLSPDEYASFRNLVLTYAQEKGADPALKKKIDAQIATFGTKRSESDQRKKGGGEPEGATPRVERHGRRIIPSFMPTFSKVDALDAREDTPSTVRVSPSHAPTPRATSVEKAVPPPPSTPPRPEVPLRSPEEHRTRIMEIKRHVISLVGNPISLVDHGNTIGRDYMMALLNALKATSPGTTINTEDAMATLEMAYEKIIAYQSRPKEDAVKEVLPPSPPPPPAISPLEENPPTDTHAHVPLPEVEVAVSDVPPPPPPPTPPTLQKDEVVVSKQTHKHVSQKTPTESVIDVPSQMSTVLRTDTLEDSGGGAVPEEIRPETPPDTPALDPVQVPDVPLSRDVGEDTVKSPLTEQAKQDVPEAHDNSQTVPDMRWTEEGGDTDVEEQIKELRKQLGELRPEEPKSVRILDGIPQERDATASLLSQTDEGSPRILADVPMDQDEFAAIKRSTESFRSLGTPQGDLMSPEVTMALTELLHEWKIFASSGIFGLGPGGVEHPLYVQIASLPMGEVIAGRFEGVDMKIVHIIKDYVNAWRHEQGIAYNPSETFEHYLRRVAQRILRRQQGLRD